MSEYRVLARKYRPASFDDLIGQEVLVRTLSNAIARNRLAHAFLLTGIRGIGKTTTARIIAKALNCIGPDGQGGPTIQPCGECPNCVAITEDRHVDVLEMDAASRTGVDDIRDLIETVHYAPTSARYKVYIIDEVHMLSKSAFNALLKTLEEPPAHVKFVFATTEIRKIPVTILSRCQRFDLKRIDGAGLAGHLRNICTKEQVQAEEPALAMIAAAAEGSVRDALSLLDQAIAHAEGEEGAIAVTAERVGAMLGLSDKHRNFVLLEALFGGDIAAALTALREQYAAGADPVQILQELLERVHGLTQRKTGVAAAGESVTEDDNIIAGKLAEALSLTQLTRSWQMLLKGLQEAQFAPDPLMAAEMVLIRIGHMAELPNPADLVKQMRDNPPTVKSPPPGGGNGAASQRSSAAMPAMATARAPAPAGMYEPTASLALQPVLETEAPPVVSVRHFDDVLALFEQQREMILYHHLEREARLVSFTPGRMEINFSDRVAADVPGKIGQKLSEWTGRRWVVILSQQAGDPSRFERKEAAKRQAIEAAKQNPLVATVLEKFPGSEIIDIEHGDRQ